mmetsp:Transcript_2489/g.7657  ORF Transcript_2489/g.7657 Transcript_2489/m.7657 type:complete len:292 (-) Transcript_2489:105-980(-)
MRHQQRAARGERRRGTASSTATAAPPPAATPSFATAPASASAASAAASSAAAAPLRRFQLEGQLYVGYRDACQRRVEHAARAQAEGEEGRDERHDPVSQACSQPVRRATRREQHRAAAHRRRIAAAGAGVLQLEARRSCAAVVRQVGHLCARPQNDAGQLGGAEQCVDDGRRVVGGGEGAAVRLDLQLHALRLEPRLRLLRREARGERPEQLVGAAGVPLRDSVSRRLPRLRVVHYVAPAASGDAHLAQRLASALQTEHAGAGTRGRDRTEDTRRATANDHDVILLAVGHP